MCVLLSSTSHLGLTAFQGLSGPCSGGLVGSAAPSPASALRVPRASPLCQRGCRLPWVQETVPRIMPPERRATNLVPSGAICALASLGSPSSPVTLCVCLSRAMVCSQRNTSLSQSPRVGFLSSLLPQSKKSPSRLSPAQGPSQAQSSAKKEPFGGQVSAGPAFLTPAKRPLTADCTFGPCLFSP